MIPRHTNRGLSWVAQLKAAFPRISYYIKDADGIKAWTDYFDHHAGDIDISAAIEWGSRHLDSATTEPTPAMTASWWRSVKEERLSKIAFNTDEMRANTVEFCKALKKMKPEDRYEQICQAVDGKYTFDPQACMDYAEKLPGGNPGRLEMAANLRKLFEIVRKIGTDDPTQGGKYHILPTGNGVITRLEPDDEMLVDNHWQRLGDNHKWNNPRTGTMEAIAYGSYRTSSPVRRPTRKSDG
jgi:hypothetical protein